MSPKLEKYGSIARQIPGGCSSSIHSSLKGEHMNSDARRSEKNAQRFSGQCLARIVFGSLVLSMLILTMQGCGKQKAMDAIWSADLVDHNGIAFNPVWKQQSLTGQVPDVCAFCPCGNNDGSSWTSAANCTDQTIGTNSSWKCFGHWNYVPVTYRGTVTWGQHSNSVYDDDDYSLYLKRSDQALETTARSNGIEIEFDSEETVDYWDNTNTWWDDFHHNYVDNNDDAAHGRIDGKDTIVVGLLGFDGQHTPHTEIHPVYAMFVHVQDDPNADRWAFFVRNWGNEGFCASDQENLEGLRDNVLQVLIPHANVVGMTETDNVWAYGDDTDERNKEGWGYQKTSDGLLLSFGLRDPSKQVGFVGDITINWATGPVVPNAVGGALAPPNLNSKPPREFPGHEDGDREMKAKFEKLDPESQKSLLKLLDGMNQHPKSLSKPGTPNTGPIPELVKPSGKYPTNGNMVKSVPDPAFQARKAKQREAIDAFMKGRAIQ
jgi:hypothetical protein